MDTSEALAYVAGIIDGEGYIGANKRQQRGGVGFQPRLAVAMTEDAAIRYALAVLPGGRYSIQQRPHSRPLHTATWCAQRAATACRLVLPYLRVKGDQARLLIRLADLRRANHHVGSLQVSNRAEQETLYDQLRALKRGRTASIVLPEVVEVERPLRHGSRFGYQQGCRCERCRQTNAQHSREQRRTITGVK